MALDAELVAAAWHELTLTTDSYPAWKRKGYPASSHWAKSRELLDQVGAAPPSPPPPTGTGALLAAQCGGYGYTMAQARAQIESRQAAMGRKYALLQFHYDGGGKFGGVGGCEDPTAYSPTCEQYALDNGSDLIIAWTPGVTIGGMLSGLADPIMKKMAGYWASYPTLKVIVRAFAEFNLPTDYGPFGPGGPYTPAQFRLAWQHMVNTMRPLAPNVEYGYCMDEGNNRDWVNSCYPGDAYVDWIMPDSYNRSKVGDGSSSTWLHTGWAEFREVFNYSANAQKQSAQAGKLEWSMYDIFTSGRATRSTLMSVGGDLPADLPTTKPMLIGETGTIYDTGHPAQKGQWFRNIPAALALMPGCRGISFFDEDVTAVEGASGNFFVNYPASDPSCLAGFVAMAQDPAFQGR